MNKNLIALAFASTFLLTGCGGGGGGDDFVGAADVFLDAQPRTIDSGDRMRVQVHISQIHENGIALKVKYNAALFYVKDSATLEINGSEDDQSLTPDYNVTDTDESTFLVFFLSDKKFGEDEDGTLTFELQGKEKLDEGTIAVDPDVDDPDILNTAEFDAANPAFDPEDEISIKVKG